MGLLLVLLVLALLDLLLLIFLLLLLPLLLLLLLLLLLFLLLLRRRRLLLHPPPLGVYGGLPRPLFFCMLPRFPHHLYSPGAHFWTGWWGYAKRLEFSKMMLYGPAECA